MRYWVLKLSRDSDLAPGKWLRKGALSRDGTNHALVKQRPAPGDRCFYWQPSPRARLVGLGTFLRVKKSRKGRLVATTKADTGELPSGLELETLRSIPTLKEKAFIKPGYPATFYAVDERTAGLLFYLVSATAPLYRGAWSSVPPVEAGLKATKAVQVAGRPAAERGPAQPPRKGDSKQMAARMVRRGQARFRDNLLAATGSQCEITGSRVTELLDACHIKPHAKGGEYALSNGVLLRTDIHALIDAGLLSVNLKTLRLECHPSLEGTEYWKYRNKTLHSRLDGSSPDPTLLRRFWGSE